MAKIDWQYVDGTVSNVITGAFARDTTDYQVTFIYQVDGHFYGGEFHSTTAYQDGEAITVGYDPSNPEKNDLVHNQFWYLCLKWVMLLMLPAIILSLVFRSCK